MRDVGPTGSLEVAEEKGGWGTLDGGEASGKPRFDVSPREVGRRRPEYCSRTLISGGKGKRNTARDAGIV